MNRLFNPVVSDFPYAYTLASPLLSSSDFAPVALASTITVRIVRLSTVTPLKIYQWPVVTALSMSALVDPDAQADELGGLFIQCDVCKVWQHGGCVGIMDEAASPDEYFCEECRKDLHKVTSSPKGYVLVFIVVLI